MQARSGQVTRSSKSSNAVHHTYFENIVVRWVFGTFSVPVIPGSHRWNAGQPYQMQVHLQLTLVWRVRQLQLILVENPVKYRSEHYRLQVATVSSNLVNHRWSFQAFHLPGRVGIHPIHL